MKKILSIVFLIQLSVYSQPSSIDLHTPANIKKFADHLFCEGDYLRTIEQYQLLSNQFVNDTIEFKLILSYSNLGLYNESNEVFGKINTESKIYSDGYLLSIKNQLLLKPEVLRITHHPLLTEKQSVSFNRLTTISTLYSHQPVFSEKKFVDVFDKSDEETVTFLYKSKFDPPYKSSALAGIMSAVVPGSGKAYVGEWSDGITGFLLTGLFAFLAYDNFKANHDARAWIFTGIGAFFYAGNIYGSISSAQIFNARIDFEFQNGLKLFLENNNYFLPEYDFCK